MNRFKIPLHSNSAATLGVCKCSNCSKDPLQEPNRTTEDIEMSRQTLTTLQQLIQTRLEVDNALERLNYHRRKLGLPAIKLRKAD